jgi:hypothetical protein
MFQTEWAEVMALPTRTSCDDVDGQLEHSRTSEWPRDSGSGWLIGQRASVAGVEQDEIPQDQVLHPRDA